MMYNPSDISLSLVVLVRVIGRIFLKNCVGRPSGPGHLLDCNDLKAATISASNMGSFIIFLDFSESIGMSRSLRKLKMSLVSPLDSEVYNLV